MSEFEYEINKLRNQLKGLELSHQNLKREFEIRNNPTEERCKICINHGMEDDCCDECDGLKSFIHINNKRCEEQDRLYNNLCDKVSDLNFEYNLLNEKNNELTDIIHKLQKDLQGKQFLLERTEQDLEIKTNKNQELLLKLKNITDAMKDLYESI